jgi:hypothetical protein
VPHRNPPPDRDTARSWPEQILQKLREADIRQVTYVPDPGHARLIKRRCSPLRRRGSAFCPAPGSAASAQSSGVDSCINALSLARVCGFPLLMIVTMRGDWGEVNPWQVPMGQITASILRLAGAVVL